MIKLPNISEDRCPDAPCADLSTIFPDPESQQYIPRLVIKPELIVVCADTGAVQFEAALVNAVTEQTVAQGLAWSSSDASVISINATSGLAAVSSAGESTISVTWQGYSAYAKVLVLSGSDCCESRTVGTVIALDVSPSMATDFGDGHRTRLDAARVILGANFAQLNEKDAMALFSFDTTPQQLVDFTATATDLLSALGDRTPVPDALDVTEAAVGKTDIKSMLEAALDAFDIPPAGGPERYSGTAITPTTIVTDQIYSAPLHGNGPPAADLGVPGDTYVDDDDNALYWKSTSGWNPT